MTSATSSPEVPIPGPPAPRPHGARALAIASRALRALWLVGLPLALTAATIHLLVPVGPQGSPPPIAFFARACRSAPLLVGVALFVSFSLMARYWWARWERRQTKAQGTGAHGSDAAERPAPRRGREIVLIAIWVGVAVLVALAIRGRVAEAYSVSSASMLPTMQPGDELLGNKLAYVGSRPPRRGDVVAFRSSAVSLPMADAPPLLVKRVIGLPGDHVRMQAGLPILNGWPLPTCDVGAYIYPLPDGQGGAFQGRMLVEFLDDRAYLTVHSAPRAFTGEYEVKPGEVFVLGDNRSNSVDSRAYNDGHGGGVPNGAIEARLEWFLVGAQLDGRSDWTRTLRPIDALATRLHLEGVDRRGLDQAIAKCLASPPKSSHPPPPSAAQPATSAPALGGM